MMPLTFASVGEENMIRKVGGNSEIRAHLEKSRVCHRRKCNGGFHHRRESYRECEGFPCGNQPMRWRVRSWYNCFKQMFEALEGAGILA